ncbi:hypothetical protein TNCV_29711 [Trichonephila clavipes]|nr:hypothetical protein TNCV_29711 [Trichonephila clavipes]
MDLRFIQRIYSKYPLSRKSSRVVGGRRREVGGPWPPLGSSPSKLGVQLSKIILLPAKCSKLRLTTGVKILALSRDEFRGSRSDL